MKETSTQEQFQPEALLQVDDSAADFTKVGTSYLFYKKDLMKIDLDTARDMVDIYKSRRIDLIKQRENIDDTKSVWFDLPTLEKMIEEIKKEPNPTGVRIYFGVYPNGGMYSKQTSIILIGTYKGEDGKQRDKLIDLIDGEINLPSSGGQKPWGPGADPYNHGNLCPGGQDCP